MNWKSSIQVLDLDDDARLEATCRKCGRLRWITRSELMGRGAGRLWLDEIENRARCRQRGCGGQMRLALPGGHATSGFVGGIA